MKRINVKGLKGIIISLLVFLLLIMLLMGKPINDTINLFSAFKDIFSITVDDGNGKNKEYSLVRDTDGLDEIDYSELYVNKQGMQLMLEAELNSYESKILDMTIKTGNNSYSYEYDYRADTYSCRIPWQFIYAITYCMEDSTNKAGKLKTDKIQEVIDAFSPTYSKEYDYYEKGKLEYSNDGLENKPHTKKDSNNVPVMVMHECDSYLFKYVYTYTQNGNVYTIDSRKRCRNKKGFIARLNKIGLDVSDVSSILSILDAFDEDKTLDVIVDEINYVMGYGEAPSTDWKKAYGIFEVEIEEEATSSYTGKDTCIDGMVYDNPNSPIYKGLCAKQAKKLRNYIRPILKKKKMEAYIDIIVSMAYQESTFGQGDNGNWMQVNGYSGEAGMASVVAGINHFKGNIEACKAKKIKDVGIAIQAYNMGSAYISYCKGDNSKKVQTAFAYAQSSDGHWGHVGYSEDVLSRVKGQKPKVNVMPLYIQTDPEWNSVRFGTSTIGTSGCGICSVASVASYWTGKKVTPKDVVSFSHSYYVSGQGAKHGVVADGVAHYKLQCKELGANKEKMVEELKKGHTIVAIMHETPTTPSYFTDSGHFIVLREIDKNGKISICDSGSRERNTKKYTADFIHSNGADNYWSIYK